MKQCVHRKEIPAVESLWYGYRRIDFSFSGRDALLIFPKVVAEGKPWVQYTEYFDAFPCTAMALVEHGYHLAFIKNTHRWGCEEDYLIKKEFGEYLSEAYGLSKRTTLLGMSCGGMIAVHMSARFPETVEALYLDAPVMNLLSCPLALGNAKQEPVLIEECLQSLGTTVSEMLSFRGNPIDEIPALITARIPVAMVYGDVDTVVPYEENGSLLEKAYLQEDCPIRVWGKKDCGHHPHGLEDPLPVVEQLEIWRSLHV